METYFIMTQTVYFQKDLFNSEETEMKVTMEGRAVTLKKEPYFKHMYLTIMLLLLGAGMNRKSRTST